MAIVELPTKGMGIKEVERITLVQALSRCGWVQADAAKLLKISPRVINYKIKCHKIVHPSGRWTGYRHLAKVPVVRDQARVQQPTGRLTEHDVAAIRQQAESVPGSLWARAGAIARKASGLFGAHSTVYEVLRRESWKRSV